MSQHSDTFIQITILFSVLLSSLLLTLASYYGQRTGCHDPPETRGNLQTREHCRDSAVAALHSLPSVTPMSRIIGCHVTMSRRTHLTLSSRAPSPGVSVLVCLVSAQGWPPHALWPHSQMSAHSGPNSGLALTEL